MSKLNNHTAVITESDIVTGLAWVVHANGYWLKDIEGNAYSLLEVFPDNEHKRDLLRSEGHSIANGLGYEF